jgi:hypothetical protein
VGDFDPPMSGVDRGGCGADPRRSFPPCARSSHGFSIGGVRPAPPLMPDRLSQKTGVRRPCRAGPQDPEQRTVLLQRQICPPCANALNRCRDSRCAGYPIESWASSREETYSGVGSPFLRKDGGLNATSLGRNSP